MAKYTCIVSKQILKIKDLDEKNYISIFIGVIFEC